MQDEVTHLLPAPVSLYYRENCAYKVIAGVVSIQPQAAPPPGTVTATPHQHPSPLQMQLKQPLPGRADTPGAGWGEASGSCTGRSTATGVTHGRDAVPWLGGLH